MLDKINELETIMLGKEKGNPTFAWLKIKFDELRRLAAVQQSVQRTALRMWIVISVSINVGLLIVLAVEIGSR